MNKRRFLAEWEKVSAILMAFPEEDTDWHYILEEAREQYHRIIKCMTDNGQRVILLCHDAGICSEYFKDCNGELIRFAEVSFNDTWTRDYGPLTIEENGEYLVLDFGFNGWGLKFAADKDNLVNRNLTNDGFYPKEIFRNETNFILEGGSVETDGKGTILTTSRCLCSPNRNGGLTKEEAAERLKEELGGSHILFLDHGELEGDDTDSHIDTLARLAPGNTILFTGCRDMEDPHFEELLKMRAQLTTFRTPEGEPYNMIELPFPSPIYDEEGNRLPATYSNYLVTDRMVFMPTYNQSENDRLAMMMMKIAFPEHKVVGIDCRTLIKQHGSLHCATMQLPEGTYIS